MYRFITPFHEQLQLLVIAKINQEYKSAYTWDIGYTYNLFVPAPDFCGTKVHCHDPVYVFHFCKLMTADKSFTLSIIKANIGLKKVFLKSFV